VTKPELRIYTVPVVDESGVGHLAASFFPDRSWYLCMGGEFGWVDVVYRVQGAAPDETSSSDQRGQVDCLQCLSHSVLRRAT
jgi:hypothetical protein